MLRQKFKLYDREGKPIVYEKLNGKKLVVHPPALTFRKLVSTGSGKTVMNKPIIEAKSDQEFGYAGLMVKYLIDIKKFDIAKSVMKKMNIRKHRDIFFKTWKTEHFLNYIFHFIGNTKMNNSIRHLKRESLIDIVLNHTR